MSDFVLTLLAEHDLNDIWEYQAERDIHVADQVVEEIHDTLARLARKRLFGHPRPDLTDKPLLFQYIRDRYVLVYRTDRTPLSVLCIAGATQDLLAILAER